VPTERPACLRGKVKSAPDAKSWSSTQVKYEPSLTFAGENLLCCRSSSVKRPLAFSRRRSSGPRLWKAEDEAGAEAENVR
jgi:hypothetical protein